MQQTNRRDFLRGLGLGMAATAVGSPRLWAREQPCTGRLNILLITVDDMNCDSMGTYGCAVPGITPNMDRLAGQSMRFEHAHVQAAICMPARIGMLTGRYGHCSGAEGFQHVLPNVTTLNECLAAAGYLQGCLGKVGHCSPKAGQGWDYTQDIRDLGYGRSPSLYRRHSRELIERADAAGRPFFLMFNSHDPHRPWHGEIPEPGAPGWDERFRGIEPPSRVYEPDEITVPGFLPDHPTVRRQMARYYSSVRRADDAVGVALGVLEETGHTDDTLVMFLSDNGIAMPYAKTNCYLHSTHTPLMVRWPGRVAPGTVDRDHLLCSVDFMPTLLEAAGLPLPTGMNGRSFLPVLTGGRQDDRDYVFTQLHMPSNWLRLPIRCVQDRRYGYMFNPFSGIDREFANNARNSPTFKVIEELGQTDAFWAQRADVFINRPLEELYDFEKDPDALRNVIDDPAYADVRDRLRGRLEQWMKDTADPALLAFQYRDNPEVFRVFMAEQDAHTQADWFRERGRPRQ